jgi:hypothetical protein
MMIVIVIEASYTMAKHNWQNCHWFQTKTLLALQTFGKQTQIELTYFCCTTQGWAFHNCTA